MTCHSLHNEVAAGLYQRLGVALDASRNELTVDLSEPRTIRVSGRNERTGASKDYLLKVTQSGKLVLQ